MEGAPLLGSASGGRVAHGHCGAGTDAQTPTSKGADPSSDTGPDPFKVRFPYAQRKQLGTYLPGILGPRQSRGGLQQRRRLRCPSSLARLDWPLRTPGPAIVIVSPPAKHQPHPPQPPLTTPNPTNLRTARSERDYQLGKGRKVHLRTASPTTPSQPKTPPICTGGDNTFCDTDDDEAIPPQSTSNPERNPSSPNPTASRPDLSDTLRP